MPIKADYLGNWIRWSDEVTSETVRVEAPVAWNDDFFGTSNLSSGVFGENRWDRTILNSATIANLAGPNGLVELALTSANEAQGASMLLGTGGGVSALPIDIRTGGIFEMYVKMSVLPSVAAVKMVFGLGAAQNADPDAVTTSCWFQAVGNGTLLCQTDDATTDSSATSGVTALNTEWKRCRIDARNYLDIRFFVDNVAVATGTTFSMAAVSTGYVAPYIAVVKASGTGVGTLVVDYHRGGFARS